MNCGHCGANLSLEDLKRTDCPYCRTVLPHHARAAEHAVLVNQVLQQRIGAQYPGTPPAQIPQIGYHYGAPLQGQPQFAQHQMGQAVGRAGWIIALAVIVPIVTLMVIGAAVAIFVLAR